MAVFDLDLRTIEFSIKVIQLTKSFAVDESGKILARQLIRSSTSVALNNGESKGGESKRDFIHKLKISLKELHETRTCLLILNGIELRMDRKLLAELMNECRELIAIFTSSINTAQQRA